MFSIKAVSRTCDKKSSNKIFQDKLKNTIYTEFMCKKCGKPINQTSITRSSTCNFCGADLHSCINCKFYSKGSHYDCRETVGELVKDKERANFCDYFSVAAIISADSIATDNKAANAKAAFNALFGD